MTKAWALILCLACAVAGCSILSDTPPVNEPFRGQTIRILVGSTAGGGYDLYARVMADFMGRHLSGTPVLAVETMAGAGGLIAANYLARLAPPDGLTIGFLSPGVVLPQLLQWPTVHYDVRQFAAIGAPMFEDADVCVSTRDSGIDLVSWQNRVSPVRVGSRSSASASHARSALITSALGLPVRFVTGYGGTAEMRLAMERGEVDAICTGLSAYRTTIEPLGKYVVVLQSGEDAASGRGVPSAERLVKDERGRSLLDVLAALRSLDRFYLAPPNTPDHLVAALRTAFDATMRDEQFLAAARLARLEIRPLNAHQIESRIAAVLNLPDDRRRDIAALLTPEPTP